MRIVEGDATVEDLDAFLDELAAVGEATGCTVQAFDARYVVGREHLERAVELADRAFARGENVARDRAVEILLYAAGRRQIDRALEMGVSEGTGPVVVVIEGADDRSGDGADAGGADEGDAGVGDADEDAAAERVAALLEAKREDAPGIDRADPDLVRAFFGIADEELAATAGGLADLVHERVALLDVEK